MNEEEIIKYTKNIINATYIEATLQDKEGNIIEQGFVNKDVIQGLLDLYKQEKEKNNELELRNEALGDITLYNQKNSISKDKIKEKIEELNNKMAEYLYIIKEFGEIKGNREKLTMYKEQRDILQELLEEE